MSEGFQLKFWGVRGTIPVPGPSTLRYGGNTSCVEVRCNGLTIILDAGSGIRQLGGEINVKNIDILLSHTHIDHIIGLPFFAPLYDSNRRITLWAGHLQQPQHIRGVIGQLMCPPLFPLTPEQFHAATAYNDFTAGEAISTPHWQQAGIAVYTMLLAHPDRATGYRIEYKGKALCYITDYEHVMGVLDPALVTFIRHADCLIYDSTYSDEEFASRLGWGHSTWQQAVRLADAASVKTLALFHHDPDATDAALDERGICLEEMRANSLIATESMVITL